MKKTIFTYGLLSGGIMMLMILITCIFKDSIGFDKGEYFGYTTILLAFTLVFFGIRSYKINNEEIGFWKAFGIGIAITTISSVLYVISWMVVKPIFMPNFYQDYAQYYYDHMKAAGASTAKLLECKKQMNDMIEMTKNPIVESLLVFIEPFPVGIVVTLISALILRKKNRIQISNQ
jgi:hypothetical protein